MLDNLTQTTEMATSPPQEILADAKIFQNKQQQNNNNSVEKLTNPPITKTNKTKTILNWLKNSTTTKNNYNNNNSLDNTENNLVNHNNTIDRLKRQVKKQQQVEEEIVEKLATHDCHECTCPTVKQQNNTRSNKSSTSSATALTNYKDDDTLREFRGVQTLKHLWNKRITANKESALRAKGKQFTKSVSCLVNTFNTSGEPPPLSEEERLKVRKLRALSLHDCSRLSREDSPEFDEISLSDIDIQKHLEKDNFYKYKTAEQASKLRELSESSSVRRITSNVIILPKTERLQWLKRHDLFMKRKSIEDILSSSPHSSHATQTMRRVATTDTSAILTEHNLNNDIIINEFQTMHSKKRETMTLPTASCQTNNEIGNSTSASEASTPTLTATNSPQYAVSRKSLTSRKDSVKTLASGGSISRDSSTTSLTASVNGQRSQVKRNSSTRKYSFKTHSRSYHAPRKMHANKDHGVCSTGQVANPPNSMVAKLTQQFNERIQKDKTLLEEIKRKNGVIMTHKGHVYKVVDTNSLNRNQSPSISRSSSRAQERNGHEHNKPLLRPTSSTVQNKIKIFERGSKPTVPLKSKEVLKKKKELVINKLVNPNGSKQELEAKAEVKPQTLNIPSTLAMVKEEAKTPVEAKDISMEKSQEQGIIKTEETKDIHRTKTITRNFENNKESNMEEGPEQRYSIPVKTKDITKKINLEENPVTRNFGKDKETNLQELTEQRYSIPIKTKDITMKTKDDTNMEKSPERRFKTQDTTIKTYSKDKETLIKDKETLMDPNSHNKEVSSLHSGTQESLKNNLKNKENILPPLTTNEETSRIDELISPKTFENVDSGLPKPDREIINNIHQFLELRNNLNVYETKSISEISNISNCSVQSESTPTETSTIKEDYNSQKQHVILDKEYKDNHIKADESNRISQLYENKYNNKQGELELSRISKDDNIMQSSITGGDFVKSQPENFEQVVSSPTNTEYQESLESSESNEDDEKRKRKHKYAKIYEKLRFFTPFAHSNKKQKLTATSPNSIDIKKPSIEMIDDAKHLQSITYDPMSDPPLKLITHSEESTQLAKLSIKSPNDTGNTTDPLQCFAYTPMSSPSPKQRRNSDDEYSIMFNPEAKLLDALEEVDKKLQNLNLDNVPESDEYGEPIKPNTSFLHQNYTKEILSKSPTIIQAVNVTLVNAIEGEQMIMEQKELQQQENEEKLSLDSAKEALEEEEPLYEPICTVKIDEIKTEDFINHTSVTYKSCEFLNTTNPSKQSYSNDTDLDIIEDDIYQTVEEVKKDYSRLVLQSPEIIINAIPELDGYEPIENPDDSKLSLKCDITVASSSKIIHFDGYEECTPQEDTTPVTPTNLGVRKVTDELPDLPQPKRVLPKSPIPCRTAPKPPLPLKHVHLEEEVDDSLISPSHESYYGGDDDENIYDTIKGPHCYESLQSVNNKLQSCPPPCVSNKNHDSVSLSSNCYESITQFRRTHIIGPHSGSSNGSTLTISSDNKTNSLYEDSLTSSLHYSSKRIYRSNTHSHIENNKSSDVGSVNNGGYAGSIGHTSDTSDEWTDVSDTENGDVDECNKPQFIIVRERSKVHKSPDWSRRVRDKRQRKSKSCIEEDDPDHYYEQLSPQALSKRHSLLEQTRTNSLQRNQESVRVSKRGKKMSYSAHALGQHISDDSFDSDTDDYYESEHIKNAHNDSGVDIRTTKLPEPPSSSNRMYSIVKNFKNFIVNKKSPNSSKTGSQQKIYDNASQFYVSGQFEGKSSSLQVPETKELSTSEKNLIMAQSTVTKPDPPNTLTTPRKPKAGKSLRSRLRKSLVGFDNKQLSTLQPTRSTFYIEDPIHDDSNGQLDSGFSEKALSGELPTNTSTQSTDSHKFSTLNRKAKKEAKLANSQRRRTTIGIRPNDPPPPPPPTENPSKTNRHSNTSWYAECGVFKNGTTNLVHDDSQILNSQTGGSGSNNSFTAGSTWYEEAGLYQTSGISVASSSGSSGVSTSNEAGPADEISHSMFSNEPLYQIYSAAKLEAISRDMQDGNSTDGYEEIGDRQKNGNSASEENRKSSRPSALQLVEPKSGPERTLWSHIPEVINSYIIPTMTQRERALMEAKFEIITSEASYLKSLNLLRTHYMNHPIFRDPNIVTSRDRKSLFAHIVPVHECSEKLLTELESCWQDNIMLVGLSRRIYTIAEKYFHVYIGFCKHQGRMDRTLKHLRLGKGIFSQNLELLESSPSCCGLNLHSFLMLPMQRITRLPLLIDAVFSKCHPNDDEYENWKMCLAIMNKIVTQCNEAANKSEQAFEIERISRQLEFNHSSIRPLAIAPAGVMAPGAKPRYLVKKGELTHLIWRGDDAKLTFGKKFSKTTIFAFLFSDLLVLTKRKAEEHFSVFDYCPRNMLTITSGDTLPQLPTKDLNSPTSKNLILMTLLENHERKTVELLLSCPSVSEQERWLQAMRPPESETPGEKLYEQWDCPQVIAKHLYENNEPDVLNLEVGDVVNVTRKLPDGWYKGERIRDGAVGWFPGSYTEEVNSVHVRARNLKQRHRLLTFTATYLESQKRNK